MYTDKFITDLLNCEKQIVDPPTREYKEERGQLKKNFTLQSSDGNFSFYGFVRGNVYFKENFSIGLDYNPKEEKGTICLLRCNGAHGENRIFPHHSVFHIHKASAETINSGLKPESNIEKTEAYASLEEAIQYFLTYINLNSQDKRKYFPENDSQTELKFDNE